MEFNTKVEYLRLAQHFYATRIEGQPTAKKVIDALKNCAHEYRPSYWRRLRNALCFSAKENKAYKAADKIAKTKNPITSDNTQRKEIKPKQNRVKKVSDKDNTQLQNYLFENREIAVFCAITLVSHLGCRPAELKQLEFLPDNQVHITSAKKRDDRGLDRIITVEHDSLYRSLKESHSMLFNCPFQDPVRYVQKRLATITQKLWPQRKARPSLYSWRHQVGSNLKASDLAPSEIAAIMGHRSTNSVDAYGSRLSSTGKGLSISADEQTVSKVKSIQKSKLYAPEKEDDTFTLNDIASALLKPHLRTSPSQS